MIRRIDRFTLDASEAEATAKSVLLADGLVVGRVHGSHIDAQFAVGDDGYVLFVSFDDMFSAIESIYFVSSRGRVEDEIRLGDEMAQGLLTEVEIEGADRIRFAFPMNERHVLRIARASRWLGLRQRWLHLDA